MFHLNTKPTFPDFLQGRIKRCSGCVVNTKSQSRMDIVLACTFKEDCVGFHHLPPGEDRSSSATKRELFTQAQASTKCLWPCFRPIPKQWCGHTTDTVIHIKQCIALLSQTGKEIEVGSRLRHRQRFLDWQLWIMHLHWDFFCYNLHSGFIFIWQALELISVCFPQFFHRGQSSEMAFSGFLILTSLCIVGREALSISDCGEFARRPGENILNFNVTALIWTDGVILSAVQMQRAAVLNYWHSTRGLLI